MKFRPLTVNSLPRVMINISALSDEEIVAFAEALNTCEEMKTWFETTKIRPIYDDTKDEHAYAKLRCRRELSEFFAALLALSKVTRSMFVKDFDRLLDELGRQDFWGTEGQCDPRGDRRDELKYDR